MKISVLMSIYHKEKVAYFNRAMQSIWDDQIVKPDEIVLVQDGSLTDELHIAINIWSVKLGDTFRTISLKKNVGLGEALNIGLKECNYGLVARMDSDDIALPERFEKQFAMLVENPDIDILGSWICEFDDDPTHCTQERKVPSVHRDIVKFAKYRNPLNHMTVVFRKDAVLDVGEYLPMNGFEDYYLWMRMLMKGKRFVNLPQVLVKARTGRGMIIRRQGWKYAKDELALEKAAYQMGFWSKTDLVKNFFTRFLPRLLPVFIVERLYTLLRKF
ncbi:MAG TPA: glycosyltransferase [Sulfurimonas autotrophica]|nr:glycosyltransferase [Sulfurimonas autotrophica]